MNLTIQPAKLKGALRAPDSKSHAHRLLIAAALSAAAGSGDVLSAPGSKGTVVISDTSDDLQATEKCLHELLGRNLPGLDMQEREATDGDMQDADTPVLDCGESGSTLRFLLPLSVTAGRGALFCGRGKLPERPLHPLDLELEKHGAVFYGSSEFPSQASDVAEGTRRICKVALPKGTPLKGGEYTLPGHISSQYVTGLLMALPLIEEDSCIRITTPLQSASYIHITLAVLRRFGIKVDISEEKCEEGILPVYHIKGGQNFSFPGDADANTIVPEGDWSNGAFWLVAGALGSDIDVSGLDPDSPQGDKAICSVISMLTKGRCSMHTRDICTGSCSDKTDSRSIDAGNIPDLVPVISVLAALTPGETRIVNAQRLRIKESDRLKTTCAMLTALGADIRETEDGLVIQGKDHLKGGTVDGAGDHRIVMSAAIAATCCDGPVTILGAEAASKSYPRFFDDYEKLRGELFWNR